MSEIKNNINKKVFVSYKQTGVDEKELEFNLKYIKKELLKLDLESFIFYLDEDINLSAFEINEIFLKKIKDSDIFISLINHAEKSEGQLLEMGCAYALNKKIILLVNKKFKKNYYLSYGLKNTKIIYFEDISDINLKKIS